jgi:hypothetical protein
LVKLDVDVRIDVVQACPSGLQLRAANCGGAVQNLALQIGKIDVVVINQSDGANSGRREVQRDRRTQSTGAYQQHPRPFQTALSILADLREQDVSAVPHPLVAAKLVGINAVVVHVVVYWAVEIDASTLTLTTGASHSNVTRYSARA